MPEAPETTVFFTATKETLKEKSSCTILQQSCSSIAEWWWWCVQLEDMDWTMTYLKFGIIHGQNLPNLRCCSKGAHRKLVLKGSYSEFKFENITMQHVKKKKEKLQDHGPQCSLVSVSLNLISWGNPITGPVWRTWIYSLELCRQSGHILIIV